MNILTRLALSSPLPVTREYCVITGNNTEKYFKLLRILTFSENKAIIWSRCDGCLTQYFASWNFGVGGFQENFRFSLILSFKEGRVGFCFYDGSYHLKKEYIFLPTDICPGRKKRRSHLIIFFILDGHSKEDFFLYCDLKHGLIIPIPNLLLSWSSRGRCLSTSWPIISLLVSLLLSAGFPSSLIQRWRELRQ